MMPAHGVTFSLIFLLLLATVLTTTEAGLTHANGSAAVAAAATDKKDKVEPLVPLVGAENFKTLLMNETRRRLRSFQICALCTCCGGAKGLCLPSPCCYAINCNIPNRPFGFCSFTPKTFVGRRGAISRYFIVYASPFEVATFPASSQNKREDMAMANSA
ncbi:uncharacterized protein Pyn_41017 [Prunus yedoensis var. nudiflora]|uniref:DUF7866 domain-containing protein n=1 Tax=Prunus yedoensis var. nudiflora TaxID=2094558 RepID=A0A315A5D8_PRUYE|nr:uncharacterized protein Pyn_41017 [Prunus yedoensis var. nudiflora]